MQKQPLMKMSQGTLNIFLGVNECVGVETPMQICTQETLMNFHC
jgi:hypothetical protein